MQGRPGGTLSCQATLLTASLSAVPCARDSLHHSINTASSLVPVLRHLIMMSRYFADGSCVWVPFLPRSRDPVFTPKRTTARRVPLRLPRSSPHDGDYRDVNSPLTPFSRNGGVILVICSSVHALLQYGIFEPHTIPFLNTCAVPMGALSQRAPSSSVLP